MPSSWHHSRNGNYPCDFYVHFAVTDTCENPNAEHGFGLPTGSGAAWARFCQLFTGRCPKVLRIHSIVLVSTQLLHPFEEYWNLLTCTSPSLLYSSCVVEHYRYWRMATTSLYIDARFRPFDLSLLTFEFNKSKANKTIHVIHYFILFCTFRLASQWVSESVSECASKRVSSSPSCLKLLDPCLHLEVNEFCASDTVNLNPINWPSSDFYG